ncbi:MULTISPECIES: hypothetical protein [unclassified Spirosoma]|mgnify:CR=1 FL=1|uniref:hypothetical protein n=1 Tax=unclassified Spirosoma TaxID=2621999 RepID=UPI000958F4B4|nr:MULTISPECIES: hypothetical protein [unclassified Spirosoma]MBN8822364.1 hypothetical protein [Spirosoma sp.]OJW72338.1 MAG: hypothetical protein BGO59_14435 [Spirosoma sp. 48-14]
MDEQTMMATLLERYLANEATDEELEVFLELLREGKLDELARTYMDREADLIQKTTPESTSGTGFRSWGQWLKIAASIALIVW